MYVLRLDYPGVGNSSGPPQIFDIEAVPLWPVQDAARFLLDHTPVEHLVLAGSCFGARMMLEAAPTIAEAFAVGMVSPPVASRKQSLRGRIKRGVTRLMGRSETKPQTQTPENAAQQRREGSFVVEQRASPAFAAALETFVRRGRVYFLFGEEDFMLSEFRHALPKLSLPSDRFELEVVPGVLHSFRSAEVQATTIERLADWCSRVASTVRTTPA
jgi:pimeloyl-ACP methyl ester carboxylesterase